MSFKDRTDDWLADRRAEIKNELADVKEREDILRAERNDIDQEFMDRFAERGTTGTRTDTFTISVREDDNYPEVQDRNEFERYILDTGKIHLLQKRLSLAAIKEELVAMEEDRDAILKELEDCNWSEECMEKAFVHLIEKYDEATDPIARIDFLKLTKSLEPALRRKIEEIFSIPGIGIVTKLTVNQVKRGKK